MAREVIWTQSAIDSLVEAAEYIAKDSPSYGSALTLSAEAAAESLLEFPNRGRVVPEFREPKIRELIIGSYRLIYSVAETFITIIAFIHGARDLSAIIERGEL